MASLNGIRLKKIRYILSNDPNEIIEVPDIPLEKWFHIIIRLENRYVDVYINGSASKCWLHYSLLSLDSSLENKLSVYVGDPIQIISMLIDEYHVGQVYWNRCYEKWRIDRDKNIKEKLKNKDIEVNTFNGSLLWEPWETVKNDGTPYKVFTPYYRKGCLQANPPRKPLPIPKQLNLITDDKHSITIQELDLLPKIPWDKKIINHWKIGETAAQEKLNNFIDKGLKGYKDGRNFPAKNNVSHLSPHIHFGEVSPNQVWYKAKEDNDCDANDRDHFLSELGWREFSHSLLYNFPHLPGKNLQSKFDLFPWQNDKKKLDAWKPPGYLAFFGHPLLLTESIVPVIFEINQFGFSVR